MIELSILSGRKAGTRFVSRQSPVTIGRTTAAALQLEDEGVWERHAEVTVRDTTVGLTAGAGPVSVNGERVQEAELRNGDLLEFGSVKVRFGLSATQQRSFWFREATIWVALAVISLAQVALIYLLSE